LHHEACGIKRVPYLMSNALRDRPHGLEADLLLSSSKNSLCHSTTKAQPKKQNAIEQQQVADKKDEAIPHANGCNLTKAMVDADTPEPKGVAIKLADLNRTTHDHSPVRLTLDDRDTQRTVGTKFSGGGIGHLTMINQPGNRLITAALLVSMKKSEDCRERYRLI
jgi:hypothetical protein